MTKIKLTGIIAATMVLAMSLSVVSVSAASISDSRNGASYFTAAWQLEKPTPDGKGKMVYGFNKYAIDEDYTWTIHDTNGHTAIVTRGLSDNSSNSDSAGKWAKIEVTHNNVLVTYTMVY